VCGVPLSTPRAGSRVAGARVRAGFRKKDKSFAFARTSGVHALFTMRSSSMIVAFMRARASQDAAAETTRTPPFVGNDRGSSTSTSMRSGCGYVFFVCSFALHPCFCI